MLDEPVELLLIQVFCQHHLHGIGYSNSGGCTGMILGGLDSPGQIPDEILQFPLVSRMLVRPAITVLEHFFYDI